MKNGVKNNRKNLVGLLFVAFALLTFSAAFAQQSTLSELTKNRFASDNLKMGIKSENDGVRQSSIYFAGKYKLTEFEGALIDQLQNEKNSKIKALIGLSLYRMNSKDGMEVIKDLALSEDDAYAKRMFISIYNEFKINKSDRTAAVQK